MMDRIVRTISVAVSSLTLLSFVPVFAQSQTNDPLPVLSTGELESLVAPIALYPDPLLSQVLVAATYPLEVVEAAQWLDQNGGLSGTALQNAASLQNWDPSVQALVMFPDALRLLSGNIQWTTALGNSFLAQQTGVMDAVQRMRNQAMASGTLASNGQAVVTTQAQPGATVVEIEPANPEIVYVPFYEPVVVWGPALYPYPVIRRPRIPFFLQVGFISFAPCSFAGYGFNGWSGWNSWGWRPNWFGRTVIVNNDSHVAFNGGEGGVAARPTPVEEAAAREPHQAPIAAQVQQEHAASQNRALFASENHGAPAVAATARPGEFSGRDVVAAKAAGAPYHAPAVSPSEARAPVAQDRPSSPTARTENAPRSENSGNQARSANAPKAKPAKPPKHPPKEEDHDKGR